MIHIVIPVYNRWQFTKECLLSLRSQTYTDFKTIVVDHGSTDGTSEFIKSEFPEVILLKGNESMWWTAATNVGVRYAQQNGADYVLTLNNDLIVQSDYLTQLNDVSTNNPDSIIGSVSVDINEPSKVIYAGTNWNKWTAKYKSTIDLSKFNEIQTTQTIIETDLLPGRGTLIPVKAFNDLGLFDEIHFPHYAADEEFSNRCKKNGYYLYIATRAVVQSAVEAAGLNNVHQSRNFKYWKDFVFSRRSPVNIKRRWLWAKINSPIPPLYFLFDVARILGSQFKSNK
jgi:GT2 family glycosyltransferase